MHWAGRRRCWPGAHGVYPALSYPRATMGYMCGRFAVTTDPALLAEKIKAIDESAAATKDGADRGANYNVAPTTTVSTVFKRHTDPDTNRRAVCARCAGAWCRR